MQSLAFCTLSPQWIPTTSTVPITQLSLPSSPFPSTPSPLPLSLSAQLGAGEREGRVYSSLVRSRHFGLSHGIGRSGDLTAQQPKAIGSSLLQALTTSLTLSALHVAGLKEMKDCLLSPAATGLSLTLALLALSSSSPSARYVLIPRIDQKTCIKCITQANLIPIIIPNLLSASHTSTNLPALSSQISSLPPSSLLCILSITSCFAPRLPDDVIAIAKLCATHSIPHIINHAYGLQSTSLSQAVNSACRKGRVDVVISSMDKNFLVPVGGAIMASPSSPSSSSLLRRIAALYPGRASASSLTDLLITLLSMGQSGYRELLDRRVRLFERMKDKVRGVAERHGERLLESSNDISMAITLPATSSVHLGAMLYARGVSGMKQVMERKVEEVGGVRLEGWGGHGWMGAYLSMACAIGMEEDEVDRVVDKLDLCLIEWKKKQTKLSNTVNEQQDNEADTSAHDSI